MIAVQREFVDDVQIFRFPKLDVCIEVTSEAGQAPQLDTRVPASLFGAHFDDAEWSSMNQTGLSPTERTSLRHSIRNQLQIAGFSLEVLQRQSEDGDLELLQTLDLVIKSLSELEAAC